MLKVVMNAFDAAHEEAAAPAPTTTAPHAEAAAPAPTTTAPHAEAAAPSPTKRRHKLHKKKARTSGARPLRQVPTQQTRHQSSL